MFAAAGHPTAGRWWWAVRRESQMPSRAGPDRLGARSKPAAVCSPVRPPGSDVGDVRPFAGGGRRCRWRCPAARVRRAYRRFRSGPLHSRSISPSRAVCPGPTSTAVRRATYTSAERSTEVVAAERATHAGRCRASVHRCGRNSIWRPESLGSATFTLVCLRACSDGTPATPPTRIMNQIERFAPVSGTESSPASAELPRNFRPTTPNYVGRRYRSVAPTSCFRW